MRRWSALWQWRLAVLFVLFAPAIVIGKGFLPDFGEDATGTPLLVEIL